MAIYNLLVEAKGGRAIDTRDLDRLADIAEEMGLSVLGKEITTREYLTSTEPGNRNNVLIRVFAEETPFSNIDDFDKVMYERGYLSIQRVNMDAHEVQG